MIIRRDVDPAGKHAVVSFVSSCPFSFLFVPLALPTTASFRPCVIALPLCVCLCFSSRSSATPNHTPEKSLTNLVFFLAHNRKKKKKQQTTNHFHVLRSTPQPQPHNPLPLLSPSGPTSRARTGVLLRTSRKEETDTSPRPDRRRQKRPLERKTKERRKKKNNGSP